MRLRVPSGKIRNELPARSDSAPRAIDANDCSRIPAIHRHEPAHLHRAPEQRQPGELGLVEHVQPRIERPEQHGRVDVALVIRAEHDRAARRHVLATAHAVPDARQQQPQADAARARARTAGSSSGRRSASRSAGGATSRTYSAIAR